MLSMSEPADRAGKEDRRGINYNTCDCGNRKEPHSWGCPRCTFLDGKLRKADVIELIRTLGWVTIREVAEHLGMSWRGAFRILTEMTKSGRLRMAQVDAPIPTPRTYGSWTHTVSTYSARYTTENRYYLSGR